MIGPQQLPDRFRAVIEEQVETYNRGRTIQVVNSIPPPGSIPLDKQNHWLKILDVICVYVDMKDSTRLSASNQDKDTAGAYQLFTGSAVRLFAEFDAPYIDVRGDGAFALFDSNQPHRALAAAVTFKTFAGIEFTPRIRKATKAPVGSHIGVDQKTVLVRRLGLRRYADRTDRQNEVWAGKPVNMAAKLASMSADAEILVSDRFFTNFRSELVLKSCGCLEGEPGHEKTPLWEPIDVSANTHFDFATAHRLRSRWCENHGREFCEKILELDEQRLERRAG